MKVITTKIPDVLILEPKIFGDHRGFFMETYQQDVFFDVGIKAKFIQDNHSGSVKGTLRGLHYQLEKPQAKLLRVVVGEVFDVAVDIRSGSPTFGKWVGCTLSAENKKQFWVPKGFAHGFYVISDWAEVIYKVDDVYSPESERTILWNDPTIGISWPIEDWVEPILSNKDLKGVPFNQAEVFKSLKI